MAKPSKYFAFVQNEEKDNLNEFKNVQFFMLNFDNWSHEKICIDLPYSVGEKLVSGIRISQASDWYAS